MLGAHVMLVTLETALVVAGEALRPHIRKSLQAPAPPAVGSETLPALPGAGEGGSRTHGGGRAWPSLLAPAQRAHFGNPAQNKDPTHRLSHSGPRPLSVQCEMWHLAEDAGAHPHWPSGDKNTGPHHSLWPRSRSISSSTD